MTRHYFKEWRRALGFTQADLAEKLRLSEQSISRIERNVTSLTEDNLFAAAVIFDIDPQMIYSPPPSAAAIPSDDEALRLGAIAVPKSAAREDADKIPHLDVPVFMTNRQSDNGMSLVMDDPIEWIGRPEPLYSVRNAFAVYVVGDDMAPCFRPGDLILLHPNKPASAGDDVLIVAKKSKTRFSAWIRVLDRHTDDHVAASSHCKSTARSVMVEAEQLHAVYKIVAKYFKS